MNNLSEPQGLTCSDCGSAIECCQFCDDEDCSKALCFTCVIVATGQEMKQPHTHGG